MSQTSEMATPAAPPAGPLGAVEALRMGWRLVVSDFWPIWLIGLVAFAIQVGCGLVGAVPYIGGCFSLVVSIFVEAALTAGLIYAVRRRIDGAPAVVNDLFEGFRQRYWPSVVAFLIPLAISIVFVLLMGAVVLGVLALMGAFGGQMSDENVIVMILVCAAIGLPLLLVLILVTLLFVFWPVAIWDGPGSGWEAIKASVRVAKSHFLSLVGFAILTALIGIAAYVAGIIALCVGVFFTIPFVSVWFTAALIYLYRSWSGQALVQPAAAADTLPAI